MKPSVMRTRIAMVVVFGGLVVSGCGSAPSLVHSQAAHAAQQASLAEDDDTDICSLEYRTLLTATEAYAAMTGVLPVTEPDLVAAKLLLHEIDDFDLTIADGDYQVVAVGDRCAGFHPGTPTVSTNPPSASPAQACDVERRNFEAAFEAYGIDHGKPPSSEADLVPTYMRAESTGFDLVGTEIVAVPGVCD